MKINNYNLKDKKIALLLVVNLDRGEKNVKTQIVDCSNFKER